MNKKNFNKSILVWIEEIWEEIEIQFYGIMIAMLFFVLVYLFFHPLWMKPLSDLFKIIKLTL